MRSNAAPGGETGPAAGGDGADSLPTRATAAPFDPQWDYLAEPKEPAKACPCCGSEADHHHLLSVVDRYRLPVRYVWCDQCASAFANPRMTAQRYARFYQDGTYRQLVARKTGADQSPRAMDDQQRMYAEWLARTFDGQLRAAASGGGELLDVGGGVGTLALDLGRRYGLRPTVVEPSREECDFARAQGVTAYNSSAEAWVPDRQYAVTCLLQTVDHLVDPAAILWGLRQITGRLLLVDIVEFPALFRTFQLQQGSGHHALKVDHPTNMHEGAMEALLLRVGFRVVARAPRPGKHAFAFACEPIPQLFGNAKPGPARTAAIIRECYQAHTARWRERGNPG